MLPAHCHLVCHPRAARVPAVPKEGGSLPRSQLLMPEGDFKEAYKQTSFLPPSTWLRLVLCNQQEKEEGSTSKLRYRALNRCKGKPPDWRLRGN